MVTGVACPGVRPSRSAASDETMIRGPDRFGSRRNIAASTWAPVSPLVNRTRRAVSAIGCAIQIPGRDCAPSHRARPAA